MPGHFWDTSALVKHYHPEVGTAKVDALLQASGYKQVMSRLGVTETFSDFAGKVRAGLVTQADFDKLCRRFLADTRGKLFSVARLLVAHHKEAERLLRSYGPRPGQGIRTLDAIQLAVALDLRDKGVIDTVISADARLLAIAQAEGFAVVDPEAKKEDATHSDILS